MKNEKFKMGGESAESARSAVNFPCPPCIPWTTRNPRSTRRTRIFPRNTDSSDSVDSCSCSPCSVSSVYSVDNKKSTEDTEETKFRVNPCAFTGRHTDSHGSFCGNTNRPNLTNPCSNEGQGKRGGPACGSAPFLGLTLFSYQMCLAVRRELRERTCSPG